MTPDHLTALGIVGAVVTAIGYVASNWSPIFFFLASFGLVVQWFGDSLDGSLARYRKIERPRYGFFVDHSVDAAEAVAAAGPGRVDDVTDRLGPRPQRRKVRRPPHLALMSSLAGVGARRR